MVEKQAMPHLKGLIVGFLNPEDWGHGIIMGLRRPQFQDLSGPLSDLSNEALLVFVPFSVLSKIDEI